MSDQFEVMFEGEDGWSDWVHPIPGYRMKCCGCDLVHEMEFAIGDPALSTNGLGELNEGEDEKEGVVIFRARRERA